MPRVVCATQGVWVIESTNGHLPCRFFFEVDALLYLHRLMQRMGVSLDMPLQRQAEFEGVSGSA